MKRSLFFLFIFTALLSAKLIRVPADQPTIQKGIDESVHGDTVVVAPGTYFENVLFRGKRIVLTSRYYESKDVQFISSTIINGSTPVNSDTASCVLMINGEDSTTVLQGFTLTGGKGTKWKDEHSAGTYREGGGILTAFSGPTIRNNVIIGNEAVNAAGITGAGGGAIRSGDGSPKIMNNVIMMNTGMYGGGIVLNYCDGAIVKNNIIYANRVENFIPGTATYGGGGLWCNGKLSGAAAPHLVLNNTFYLNAATDGGGEPAGNGGAVLLFDGASAVLRNNLFGENRSLVGGPVANIGATAVIDFNSSTEAIGGTNTLLAAPVFADSSLLPLALSPTVDAGDPSSTYNDGEDLAHPGQAKYPSRGTVRNDLGAYGGPAALPFADFNRPILSLPVSVVGFDIVFPGNSKTLSFSFRSHGTLPLRIDSIVLRGPDKAQLVLTAPSSKQYALLAGDSVSITWNPNATALLSDTVLLYHNDPSKTNPARVVLTGKAFSIITAQAGTMYAFSGSTDAGKMYTADTANGTLALVGQTDFPSIISARVNPKTKEIVALVNSGAATKLVRISAQGAASLPLSTVTVSNPKGMAFAPDGTLYLGSFAGAIYTVNIATGAATQVMSISGFRISGLAFHPVTGQLWASVRPTSSGKDNIYKVNLAAGTNTLVGACGFGIPVKDITFDAAGRMFGVMDTSGQQSYLLRIDTTNGKGSVVGPMAVKGVEALELRSTLITGVPTADRSVPQQWSLSQNYPNPFNPSTTIAFEVPIAQRITLAVYDLLGREVARLAEGNFAAGHYQRTFDASRCASGMYLSVLRSGDVTLTRRMLLVK